MRSSTSKLALSLVLIGLGLLESSSAMAGEPIVAIPVTGGQFTVDLKIQNGVVQNYGYQNNQLPTLLTPVGTISLTSASAPNIVSSRQYWAYGDRSVPEPTSNVPVSILTYGTGSAGLNDGRMARFKDAYIPLQGFATASSPLSIASMGNLAGRLLNAATFPPSLPQNYDGTIAVQIQSGTIAIPSSSFSNPSNAVTRFDISSGKITSKINSRLDQLSLSSFDQILSFDPNQVDSMGQIALLSPMGTTSLNIKNLRFSNYYKNNTYDGTYASPPETVTAVTNGTVLLTNGKVVQVKDRLIWFEPEIIKYDYVRDPDELMGLRLVGVNLKQGSLYIDTPDIDTPTNILESKVSNDIPPIDSRNISDLRIASDTQVRIEAATQTQLTGSGLQQSPREMVNSDVLASPLSTSRILSKIGVGR